jgi:putative ABC transport system substrate-binding protein
VGSVHFLRGDDASILREATRKLVDGLVGTEDRSLMVEEVEVTGASVGDRAPQLALLVDAAQTPAFLTPKRVVIGRVETATAEEVTGLASAVADPIEAKLAASLEKPGGLVTGLTSQANELGAKRMELLKALAPGIQRLGALVNPDNPASVAIWKATEAAAPELKLNVEMLDVRSPEALQARLDAVVKAGIDSLIIGVETLAQAMVNEVVEFTLRQRLPSAFASRSFVEVGGLLSYGVNYPNLYYRAASYVDRILKGAKPADLPIDRPTKFELVINRKTARALKIIIPPDLFLRSDEIID